LQVTKEKLDIAIPRPRLVSFLALRNIRRKSTRTGAENPLKNSLKHLPSYFMTPNVQRLNSPACAAFRAGPVE
jgi:hypothetical protein